MSSIASTTVLRVADLARVCDAATPKRGFLGGKKDLFESVLKSVGTRSIDFDHAGIVVATVLSYLEENGIDLMKSDYDDMATSICEARQTTCFILTEKMSFALSGSLKALPVDLSALQRYWDEFFETSEPGAGDAMVAGIEYVKLVLESVKTGDAALLQIG